MYYSPHDADDAFQAIRRAERWRSVAIAAAETIADAGRAEAEGRDSNPPGDGNRRTLLRRLRSAGPRYG